MGVLKTIECILMGIYFVGSVLLFAKSFFSDNA